MGTNFKDIMSQRQGNKTLKQLNNFNYEEEKLLVEACQHGELEAKNQLIKQFQDRVYATSLRILKNKEDAEECTQEVFIKVIRKINSFRFQSKLATWIYTIAVRSCLNQLKRNKNKSFVALDQLEQKDSFNVAADTVAADREILKVVQQELQQLPQEQRIILTLGDIQQLDYQEIAKVLKIPLGTAKSRLFRARKALRDKLKERLGENMEGAA